MFRLNVACGCLNTAPYGGNNAIEVVGGDATSTENVSVGKVLGGEVADGEFGEDDFCACCGDCFEFLENDLPFCVDDSLVFLSKLGLNLKGKGCVRRLARPGLLRCLFRLLVRVRCLDRR